MVVSRPERVNWRYARQQVPRWRFSTQRYAERHGLAHIIMDMVGIRVFTTGMIPEDEGEVKAIVREEGEI